MDLLDAAGIPYGVVPGNHDDLDGGTNYNANFGVARFCTSYPAGCRSFYGDGYPTGSNFSNYTLFSAGGMDFIVVNLGIRQRRRLIVLTTWAENLLHDLQQPPGDRRQPRHPRASAPGTFDSLGFADLQRFEGPCEPVPDAVRA